jgi:hypothetical protein
VRLQLNRNKNMGRQNLEFYFQVRCRCRFWYMAEIVATKSIVGLWPVAQIAM